ncbi:MAG: endonuclease domain-containing protein [Oscillospiraceae bacterium]|nr:endonuclease domain-containing protein [Oscillospiraceae bacterium]
MQSNRVPKGNIDLLVRAQEMRNNATSQENRLWYYCLRQRPERWHRQRIIDSYIVDFYCPKAMLVIEVDGEYHDTPQQKAYDKERDAYLAGHGLRVLRFQNIEIDDHLPEVVAKIAQTSNFRQQALALSSGGSSPSREG